MTILLSGSQRKQALHHLAQFLELTVYYKIPRQQAEKITEHLAHLTVSPDELVTTVKVFSDEKSRRTQVGITMDLKGAGDVDLKAHR